MTKSEIGCYGDGTFGHQHTRERCAAQLEALARQMERTIIAMRDCARALQRPMSDDAGEETEACELLAAIAPRPDAAWGWNDGDFGLWPNGEE